MEERRMDFNEWGQEYLQESQQLRLRIDTLRAQLKTAGHKEANELNRRIYMLYSMYLECKHTGLLLQSYGEEGEISATRGA
jgi:hypothetical protein